MNNRDLNITTLNEISGSPIVYESCMELVAEIMKMSTNK
jgi:hypothetical protein